MKIKIVFLNTFINYGGAAIACARLLNALGEKIKYKLISADYSSTGIKSFSTIKKKLHLFILLIEKSSLKIFLSNKNHLFSFSHSNIGTFNNFRSIRNAEIIHLHWFNQGFISLKSLNKIIKTGKPVVWTLHDMWAFTGGCHYSGNCMNYKMECGNCFMLKANNKNDLSSKIFNSKKKTYSDANITFVTCSTWLGDIARSSSLLKNKTVVTIPNPIDTDLYCTRKQSAEYQSNKILFVSGNILDNRKGFIYLKKAIQILQVDRPIELLLVGKFIDNSIIENLDKISIKIIGTISKQEELIELYNLADITVLPTLQDNLPNTIMESMACGTPVVAFNSGGVSDMIEHMTNGYLAENRSTEDLKNGIEFLLTTDKYAEISKAAREKIVNHFSNEVVSVQYLNLYKSLLKDDKPA